MEYMTPEQIKGLLRRYYDLPERIHQELELLHDLEQERRTVSISSPTLSGIPTGKGMPGDPTGRAAEKGDDPQVVCEMDACRKRIAQYREERAWCNIALATLGRAERRILELAYLGPKDPQKRKSWIRRPYWKEIASDVGYSESQTYAIARQAISYLSDLSTQEVFDWVSF